MEGKVIPKLRDLEKNSCFQFSPFSPFLGLRTRKSFQLANLLLLSFFLYCSFHHRTVGRCIEIKKFTRDVHDARPVYFTIFLSRFLLLKHSCQALWVAHLVRLLHSFTDGWLFFVRLGFEPGALGHCHSRMFNQNRAFDCKHSYHRTN